MSDFLHDLDIDSLRSASHQSMVEHLSGPLLGGARDTPLALDDQGRAEVERPTRQPLVVVAPRFEVGAAGFQISAQIVTGAGAGEPVIVRFEPFTEAGAFLPVYHPDPLAPEAAEMPPFTVALATAGPEVPGTPLAELVELRLIEGVLGRLLYVLGAEKQRLRRQARELFAARRLEHAFGDALDRLGVELGVPRFEDRLRWNVELAQPEIVTEREPDGDYRRRLGLYRPWLMSTRRHVLEQLNGRNSSDANTGPLAEIGFRERLSVQESNSEFAVAVRLVGPARQEFLGHIRHVHLLAPAAGVPGHRLLPNDQRQRQEAMLERLRSHFEWPENAWLAPGLAWALDLVGRCRAGLQVTRPWRVLRAQDDAGGSRYELGLGVDVEVLPDAEIDLLIDNLSQRRFASGTELEVVQLLESLQPMPRAEDPACRWLLAACGIRTVHALPQDGHYLSHIPVHGMVVTDSGPTQDLAVYLNAPQDVGLDTFLFHGLQDLDADATEQEWPRWTRLSANAAQDAWATTVVPSETALSAFAAAGLRSPGTQSDLQRAVSNLSAVPGELTVTLALDASFSSGLVSNQSAAVAVLQQMVASCKKHEIFSVLPLVTSTSAVLLVVGAVALPGSAALLNTRREGFRWYVLPVSGDPPGLQHRIGSRNHYITPAQPGLAAVMAVALTRRDRADPRGRVLPYEVHLEPPAGALLDLAQYEFLMNLLEHLAPIGVTFDTRILREQHVAPDGQGAAVPLTGPLARSFRTFRQRRQPGERHLNPAK